MGGVTSDFLTPMHKTQMAFVDNIVLMLQQNVKGEYANQN